jgi:hypothetical protein
VVVALLALLALGPSSAAAAEIRTGESVVVAADETIDDDLYAFGNSVTVLGRVRGDVVVAANTVDVGGVVERGLFAAGSTVNVTGEVGGSARVAGATVGLAGPIGRDVLAGGASLTLGPAGRVGGDAVLGGGTLTVAAPVGRRLWAGGDQVAVAAAVGGDVDVEAAQLRLGPGAALAGDLRYASGRDAEVAPGATVAGTTVRREPARVPGQPAATRPLDPALAWLRGLVGVLALGLALLLAFPRLGEATVASLERAPWQSLGLGAALVAGVPVGALLLFVLGLFVGGWWLGPAVLGLYALALVVGYAAAALVVGSWATTLVASGGLHAFWRLLVGLVLLGLLTLVPVVGWIAGLAAVVFGLGAVAVAVGAPSRDAGMAAVEPIAAHAPPTALRPTA